MDPENASSNYHGIHTTHLLGAPTTEYLPTPRSSMAMFYGTCDPPHTQQSKLSTGARPFQSRDGSTHNPGIVSYSQGMTPSYGSHVEIGQQQPNSWIAALGLDLLGSRAQHQPSPLLPGNSFLTPENRPTSGGYSHNEPIYPGTSLPSFQISDALNISNTVCLVTADSTRSFFPEVGNMTDEYQPLFNIFAGSGHTDRDTYPDSHFAQAFDWTPRQSYEPWELQLSSLDPSNGRVSDSTWNQKAPHGSFQLPQAPHRHVVQNTDFAQNHNRQFYLQSTNRKHQLQLPGDFVVGNEQPSRQLITPTSYTSSLPISETIHVPPSVSSQHPPPQLSSFQLSAPTMTVPQNDDASSSLVSVFSLSDPDHAYQHHPSSSFDLDPKFPARPSTKSPPQPKQKRSNKNKRREGTQAVIDQAQTTEKDRLSASSAMNVTKKRKVNEIIDVSLQNQSEDKRTTKKLKAFVDEAINAKQKHRSWIFQAPASSAAYEKASARGVSHPDIITAFKQEYPVEAEGSPVVTPWSNEQGEFLLQSGSFRTFFESLPSGVDWDTSEHQTGTMEDTQRLATFEEFLNEM
ncbi:hypothetical protein VKT23_011097 [Stygiomarasmius scandens]|uniref:Uncharacterized protein n=1 Tax=Marasmiellus scandens TaxID=2682957 RepID=A0ABR1JF12_9AGAR